MELVNQQRGLKKKAKVLKKNVENAVESGKAVLILVCTMAVSSFLLSGVAFLGGFFPCGVALITALMYKNRLNIYLLPVIIASMLMCAFRGYYVFGDIGATLLCSIAFVLLGRREWGILPRGLIAACITVTANCAYYLGTNMLYRLDLPALILEGIAVLFLVYVFHFFLNVWFAGDKPLDVSMEKVVAASVLVFMLALCSTELGRLSGDFSIGMIGGLFVILLMGYRFGILTGVTAAGICSVVMVLCGSLSSSLALVFLCGGLAAGAFQGQNRLFAVICFAGAVFAPGLVSGHPELTVPLYAPLGAAALMIPIRKKWLARLSPIEEGLQRKKVNHETPVVEKVEETLSANLGNFEFLASLYGGRKDGRAMMGYQFNGLACAMKSMLAEVRHVAGEEEFSKEPRLYRMKMGEACYAREGQVSGDSYFCGTLKDDRYMMILSDGMGKGEVAAAESGLAVNTLAKLMESGFDAETAIKTVNSILLLNADKEIFSTIDMGILDLRSGKLRLFKVGAATTYVKRRDKVSAVKMAALPMGIVDGLRVDYINIRLRAGDQLIMVSDGIIDSCREDDNAQWLTDAIASIKSTDPQTMADLIINRAVENYGLKEKDDMTVLTFRVD